MLSVWRERDEMIKGNFKMTSKKEKISVSSFQYVKKCVFILCIKIAENTSRVSCADFVDIET